MIMRWYSVIGFMSYKMTRPTNTDCLMTQTAETLSNILLLSSYVYIQGKLFGHQTKTIIFFLLALTSDNFFPNVLTEVDRL